MTGNPIEARIVVGMPVYNAEETIAAAISSILAYEGEDLRLIVSDNASTDGTAAICRLFAAQDHRVHFIHQEHNLGAEANFDYVLTMARSRYFMWAAADDIRSPDFIRRCADFLDDHDAYAGATSPVGFDGVASDPDAMGDASLEDDDPFERMLGAVGRIHANGRFYSLLRRSALDGWTVRPKHYLGADWTLSLQLLHAGKMKRLDAGWIVLGTSGTSRRLTIFARYRGGTSQWLLPFGEFSRQALTSFSGASLAQRLRLLWRLCRINAIAAVMQVRYEWRLRRTRRSGGMQVDGRPPHA